MRSHHLTWLAESLTMPYFWWAVFTVTWLQLKAAAFWLLTPNLLSRTWVFLSFQERQLSVSPSIHSGQCHRHRLIKWTQTQMSRDHSSPSTHATCSQSCLGLVSKESGWIGSAMWTAWLSSPEVHSKQETRLTRWMADGSKGSQQMVKDHLVAKRSSQPWY